MRMPIPKPLSALQSIFSLPEIKFPATSVGSERAVVILTFEWYGEEFIGSGNSGNAILGRRWLMRVMDGEHSFFHDSIMVGVRIGKESTRG